ncbi:MAG TPA: alpha/beta hydrolase [Candidatus Baltobacteraceae bacterium]
MSREIVALDDGATAQLDRWGERGPLLLCVHGMTSSRKSWERVARHLADRYRVVAYDQRGHGDSSGVCGPMTLARATRDLENVAGALGEVPYALIGHSWGGAVVILGGRSMAVRKVVAIDPMLRQRDDRWYAEFLEDLAPIFALQGAERAAKVRAEYADWPEIDRERKVHAVATMDAGPIQRLRDENPAATWDLRETIAAYPKPLLLAMADQTQSIVSADDLDLVRERGGNHVRVAIFEGQGHSLHRTAFDAFVSDLDAFL